MTPRERWGRLWLSLFSLFFLAWCIYGLVLSTAKFINSGQINLTRNVLLPLSEIWLLVFVWTGEPWTKRIAILFYGLRGGTVVWAVVVLVAAMHAATPPEHAAAGRTVFFILMPGFAILLLFAAKDWGMVCLLAFAPSVQAFLNHQRYRGQGLWGAIREWWTSRGSAPEVSQLEIGEVTVSAGTLLLADPMYISDPCRITGLPVGRFPVTAQIIKYPEGGQRIAQVSIRFRAGLVTNRKSLGKVGVDSAKVVALDEQTYRDHWQEVGPERIGMTHSPNDNRTVAELIEKKFGLRWRPLNGFQSIFLEPIPDTLEQEITEYLKTIPEYSDYPFLYFRVETNNTFDRITEAMSDVSWAEVTLNDSGDESLLAFTSGFGDGSYDLIGVYGNDELLAIEITFIGPEQDSILEGFPFLREEPPLKDGQSSP